MWGCDVPDISQLASARSVVGSGGESRSANDRPGLEAIIASTPADETEPVYVTLENFGEDVLWGPAFWEPIILNPADYAIPSAGDRALVIISNEEEVWIVAWWPHD